MPNPTAETITYPDLIEGHSWVIHRKEFRSPLARVETRICTECGTRLRTHRTFKRALSSIIIDPPDGTSHYFVLKSAYGPVLETVDENTYYDRLMKQLNQGKTLRRGY